jgi:hypothetical protein
LEHPALIAKDIQFTIITPVLLTAQAEQTTMAIHASLVWHLKCGMEQPVLTDVQMEKFGM